MSDLELFNRLASQPPVADPQPVREVDYLLTYYSTHPIDSPVPIVVANGYDVKCTVLPQQPHQQRLTCIHNICISYDILADDGHMRCVELTSRARWYAYKSFDAWYVWRMRVAREGLEGVRWCREGMWVVVYKQPQPQQYPTRSRMNTHNLMKALAARREGDLGQAYVRNLRRWFHRYAGKDAWQAAVRVANPGDEDDMDTITMARLHKAWLAALEEPERPAWFDPALGSLFSSALKAR